MRDAKEIVDEIELEYVTGGVQTLTETAVEDIFHKLYKRLTAEGFAKTEAKRTIENMPLIASSSIGKHLINKFLVNEDDDDNVDGIMCVKNGDNIL